MGHRRKSRELAMQALFYMDMGNNESQDLIELFVKNFEPPKKVRPFFLELVNGVIREKGNVDEFIEQYSSNWKISRMSCVDRNILRVAVYELQYCPEIPSKVTINEAIDIGKKFGTRESGSFINGVIDKIRLLQDKK
jgi:N utilization substance protein B